MLHAGAGAALGRGPGAQATERCARRAGGGGAARADRAAARAAAAAAGSSRLSAAAPALSAETSWAGPARRAPAAAVRAPDERRPGRTPAQPRQEQQQQQQAQEQRQRWQPAGPPPRQQAQQQPQARQHQRQHQQRPREPPGAGAAAALAQLDRGQLAAAVDAAYAARLREVRALMSPAALAALAEGLSADEAASLAVVLDDLRGGMQGSWEEEGAGADEGGDAPGGAALLATLAEAQLLPPDFTSYLMAMLPDGSGPAELSALLSALEPGALADIQSVFDALKGFEAAQLGPEEAHARYLELSAQIADVTARVQGRLAAQARAAQAAEAGAAPAPVLALPRRGAWAGTRVPRRYSDLAFGGRSSGVDGGGAPAPAQQQAPAVGRAAATPAPGSAGKQSSKAWGSGWASRPRQARQSGGDASAAAPTAGGGAAGLGFSRFASLPGVQAEQQAQQQQAQQQQAQQRRQLEQRQLEQQQQRQPQGPDAAAWRAPAAGGGPRQRRRRVGAAALESGDAAQH
ncbi:hypothetical protein HT031_001383 [Scenedesmus sp. PABB004]|nr:hypothetical protein HT031_001383 [Scenedesmus sp. PABB004]